MLPGLWALTIVSLVNGLMLLVSYIANNTFPQPLSEEEEAKYLRLLARGDEVARNVLTERNLRLVAHIVKKFDSTGEDPDDLISIGTIGLIRPSTLSTRERDQAGHLCGKVQTRSSCICVIQKIRSEVSLYDPIGVDKEGNEITLIDILGTHPEVVSEMVENRFEQKRLREKVHQLTRREKKVLELRFGLEDGARKTQREIARVWEYPLLCFADRERA